VVVGVVEGVCVAVLLDVGVRVGDTVDVGERVIV
jgi:hypothetical protein